MTKSPVSLNNLFYIKNSSLYRILYSIGPLGMSGFLHEAKKGLTKMYILEMKTKLKEKYNVDFSDLLMSKGKSKNRYHFFHLHTDAHYAWNTMKMKWSDRVLTMKQRIILLYPVPHLKFST